MNADRATLAAMAAGITLMLLPAPGWALKAGFFVTLAATVAQIVVGHVTDGARDPAPGATAPAAPAASNASE